ncbi:hypothetical protein BH23CHL5_BH23CHL5_26460 [soil metagenome]
MPRTIPGDEMQLPDAFLVRLRSLLGDSYQAWLDSCRDDPVYGLRVNTLKVTAEDFQTQVSWNLESISWCDDGMYIDPEIRAGRHLYHAAGLYYLQGPSAMAAVEALDVQPGQWLLDISGSPDGKSTQIAARLGGSGVLVANDPGAGRVRPLGEYLERCAVRNVVITNAPARASSTYMAGAFDRGLVDAPCSGEGLFRKSPSARCEWSEAHVDRSANRPHLLLDDIAGSSKPRGLLVYSTCTFNKEENESQIWQFLDRHPDWTLEPIAEPALAIRQPSTASPYPEDQQNAGMARIWLHNDRGDGHFVALLRASVESEAPVSTSRRTDHWRIRSAQLVPSEWSEFRASLLQDSRSAAPSFGRGITFSNHHLPCLWTFR